jgi:hypothetical protein
MMKMALIRAYGESISEHILFGKKKHYVTYKTEILLKDIAIP